MTALTLEQFIATRQPVADVAKAIGFDDGQGVRPGFTYAEGCFIETLTTGEHAGNHYLLIERSDWISGDLGELEAILWEQWYVPNHRDDPCGCGGRGFCAG